MAIVSVGDILDRVTEFEKRLEDYYAFVRDEAKDGGARLLTYYLCRHRRHLETAMEQLGAKELEHIRKIRLKHDVELRLEKSQQDHAEGSADVKGQQLLDIAVQHDELLIDLYKKVLEQPLSTEVKVFVESLLRTEERDIVMLKKMVAMGYF